MTMKGKKKRNITQINVHKSTKEELMNLILEKSLERGNRVSMNELVENLLEEYKTNK